MSVYGAILPGATRLARLPADPSRRARQRLSWFRWYEEHGRNARLACRHFGLSPSVFYTWRRRYQARGVAGLENRSRRPRAVRQPTWSHELEAAVLELRERYPRWGKDKLVVLLRERGHIVSTSMVGRILTRLKAQGRLVEALPRKVPCTRARPPRPYAVRKPKDYAAREPGDLVQVDTLDLRPVPGVVLKHFTARDVIARWDVLGVFSRATAHTAAAFLEELEERMPFPIKAVQVDGGSEFMAEFETACQTRGIPLFVLPPRSPKLNGCVERAQRTHREEFYEVWDLDWTLAALRPRLREWERLYNTVRPHQALGYRTPQAFVTQRRAN